MRAAPESSAEPTTPEEVVIVRLGGSRYALPMSSVAEVGRPPGLTRVPGLPSWVAGVANWRGRVLAVLDLRSMLEADAGTLDRRGRLIVLTRDGRTAGLLTEGVEGTADLDLDQVQPVLAHLSERTGALLSGQVTDSGGPLAVLDLDAVFALVETLPRPRRGG